MERISSNFPISFELSNSHQLLSSKSKNISSSTQRRNNAHLIKSTITSSKIKSHNRDNSNIRKSKSKCETEVNLSNKKKKTEYESVSKKTIPKKKKQLLNQTGSKNQLLRTSNKISQQNKLSLSKASKERQQSVQLKNKRQKISKQIFHSTCYSRNFDINHINPSTVSPIRGHSSLLDEDKIENYDQQNKYSEDFYGIIYEKTQNLLNLYKNKNQSLEKDCQHYKKQLNKAVKELKQFKKINQGTATTTNDDKKVIQDKIRTSNLKKSRKNNIRNSKSKNSYNCIQIERNNSQIFS